ncbi:hypothetical protein K474DRAFT_1708726 [Panus rudis PR-1116 ss-1]|nr:hypothetical protein K474DRAFT_1708726 [Panus rudis PR-1116 ss-1]
MNLAQIITREDIKIDEAEREAYELDEDTEWFLRRAMTKDPIARPDATTLKRHLFFRDFNWDELSPGSTRCAPWIPGPQRIGNLARVSHEGLTLDSGRPLGPLEDSVPFFTHVSPRLEELPTLFEQAESTSLTRASSSIIYVPLDPFDSFDAQVPDLVHYPSDSSLSPSSASIHPPLGYVNASIPSSSTDLVSSLSALQFAIVHPPAPAPIPAPVPTPRPGRNRPVRKPVPPLQEESPDVKVTPPATPVRGPQETSAVLPEDPNVSSSFSSDASGVAFVDGFGFELIAPPVAHRLSDLPLSLDQPELDVQFLASEEFDSFHNSAPWARRTPVPSPANFEASTRSTGLSSLDLNSLARQEFDSFDNSAPWARRTPVSPPANFEASTRSVCPPLDLNTLAREEFDSFDNSAPWAQMPVHPQTGSETPTVSTGLGSLDLNELVREDFNSFDDSAPWARQIHPPANFEAPTACLSTGLGSLDLNNLAREEFDSFDPWTLMRAFSSHETSLNAPDVSRDRDSSSSGCGSESASGSTNSGPSSISPDTSSSSSSLSQMPSARFYSPCSHLSPAYSFPLAHPDSDFDTTSSRLLSTLGMLLRLLVVMLSLSAPVPALVNVISILWDLVSCSSCSYLYPYLLWLARSVSLIWDFVSCVSDLTLL